MVKTQMNRLTEAHKQGIRYWVTRYAAFGFPGREELNFTLVHRAIGYNGRAQSVSKYWKKIWAEMVEANPQKDELAALNQELLEAVEAQENIKEGNDKND